MSSEESSLDHQHLNGDNLSTSSGDGGCCRCCSSCNKRICFAYLLSLLSNVLVVGGVYLAWFHHELRFLLLPIVGIVLILLGSCFYRSGWLAAERRRRRRHSYCSSPSPIYRRRNKRRINIRDSQLFSSQLSLNMLPQCFTTAPSRLLNASAAAAGAANIAGGSSSSNNRYLMLPIESSNTLTRPGLTSGPHCSLDGSKSDLCLESSSPPCEPSPLVSFCRHIPTSSSSSPTSIAEDCPGSAEEHHPNLDVSPSAPPPPSYDEVLQHDQQHHHQLYQQTL